MRVQLSVSNVMPSLFGKRANNKKRLQKAWGRGLSFEQLEDRSVLSTFSVVNLNDSGAGSLRQAILDANSAAGDDVIDFEVVGTIDLTSGALPTIVDSVNIDGTTAPGYDDAPLVEIDFNEFDGFDFVSTAVDSALQALGLTNSGGDAVTLDGCDNVQLVGNYIGVALDGTTSAGNQGNGVVVDGATGVTIQGNVISGNGANGVLLANGASQNTLADNLIGTNAAGTAAVGNALDGVRITDSTDNVIGNTDPVSGIDYYNTDNVSVPVSAWQGIRAADTAGQFLISGTSGDDGLLFIGTMEGDGTSYTVAFPARRAPASTAPTTWTTMACAWWVRIAMRTIRTAFSSTALSSKDPLTSLATRAITRRSTIPMRRTPTCVARWTVSRSATTTAALEHGDSGLALGPGHAFLYDVEQQQFLTDIVYPGCCQQCRLWHLVQRRNKLYDLRRV